MIIDARQPNAFMKQPPKTKLGGAAGLAELDAFLDLEDLPEDSSYGGPLELPQTGKGGM